MSLSDKAFIKDSTLESTQNPKRRIAKHCIMAGLTFTGIIGSNQHQVTRGLVPQDPVPIPLY